MSQQYSNAPLVEVIVELRWIPAAELGGQLNTAPGAPALFVPSGAEFEKSIQALGQSFAAIGYTYTERLVPAGMPSALHHPTCRFKLGAEEGSTLYQIGPGLFTVNAVQPYRSWDEFSLVVKTGIEEFHKTRPESEKNREYSLVSIRYVDVFKADLLGGRSMQKFVEEVLGIRTHLPNGLAQHLEANSEPKIVQQIQLPVSGGMLMSVEIGEGLANGTPGLIMGTSIATVVPTSSHIDSVMDQLHAAQRVLHTSFIELTAPIQDLMQKANA